jgi:hypothetical protein
LTKKLKNLKLKRSGSNGGKASANDATAQKKKRVEEEEFSTEFLPEPEVYF